MNRRPFIKLLGTNLIGLPLFASNPGLFATTVEVSWLARVLQEGQIERVASLGIDDLPQLPKAVQSGEFIASTAQVYFYEQRQYCFQVFEKTHPAAGLLELMVPFWKKQQDGSWQKIATLNSYEITALGKALDHKYSAVHLLPLNKGQNNSYSCQAGLLQTQTRIKMDNQAHTEIRITDQNRQSWKRDFTSVQNLPMLLLE